MFPRYDANISVVSNSLPGILSGGMDQTITDNLQDLRSGIRAACELYHRDAGDITIVAVTKTYSSAVIQQAVSAGLTNIGESRIQEAEPKIKELGRIARFHLIGHLQSNKVRKAIELFDVIQSVDSLHLAQEISRKGCDLGRQVECYIEVNCSGEEQKYGIRPEQAPDLIPEIAALPQIRITGMMTVGPLSDDEKAVRRAFSHCYEAFRRGQTIVGDQFATLSMGMSDDYPLAIAEGSTMIRVGTGLFGRRQRA